MYKGGPKAEVSNYRPVSLLPLPGKLLEKIAHARMSEFFEANKVILVGSVAAERLYPALGTLTPVFPVPGGGGGGLRDRGPMLALCPFFL